MQILRFAATMLLANGIMILVPGACYYADNGKRISLVCFVLGFLMTYSGFGIFVYLSTI